MKTPPNPHQPLVYDKCRILRYKENSIVRHLLDNGEIDLNDIARMNFSIDDRIQFAQLIGYSWDGLRDLMDSFVE